MTNSKKGVLSKETREFSFQEVFAKVNLILRPELSFYVIAVIYGVGFSVLSLAIPISVQSLVNSVTFGVLFQPLLVLSVVLFLLLGAFGALNALQIYIIELFQRRFYARMSAEIIEILVGADSKALTDRNGPELVNRYFDIMTVQKNVSILLTGASSVVLQTFAGLLLLAFYHPYFLVFDALLIFCLIIVWKVFGRKAIAHAINESKAKYSVARWLEEVAANSFFFKGPKKSLRTFRETDQRVGQYLDYRSLHFKNLFWQVCLLLGVYAVMSSIVLGLGGYLVIKGQLALGQLVAAELVATIILTGLAKSGKYLEALYDLVAAVDKIGEFYELPLELGKEGQALIDGKSELGLEFNEAIVKLGDASFTFDYRFRGGDNYLIRSKHHTSKLLFIDALSSRIRPIKGRVAFRGVNLEKLSPSELSERVYIVDRPVLLEASIEENLTYGLDHVSAHHINEAIEVVGLEKVIDQLPEGSKTKLSHNGSPLWSSELIALELARAIIARPDIVIVSDRFDQINVEGQQRILKRLKEMPMTTIVFSNRALGAEGFEELELGATGGPYAI